MFYLATRNVDSSIVDISLISIPINNSNPVTEATVAQVEQSPGTQNVENQASTGFNQLVQLTMDTGKKNFNIDILGFCSLK